MNIIGIDIGGTKITGILWDGKKIADELTIVTPKNLFEFEHSLIKLTDFLSAKGKIGGVGVGIAGKVDVQRGIAAYSPNIRFIKDLQLAKFFRLNGFKQVKIDNDARCFARAEAVLGSGRGHKLVVGITLGTGIGGGVVMGGQVQHGANFGGGEVGHMIYGGQQTFEDIFQTARDRRDDKALSRIVGALLTNIYRLVDPEVVAVGGGVATDKRRGFMKKAVEICRQNLASYKIKISPNNIKISNLKHAGALGAALLIE